MTDIQKQPTRGVVGLVLAVVGVVLMSWSFVSGISAALDGSGSGAMPYEILFIAAAALVLAALVIAVVNLVRGRSRVIAVVTIVVAVIPAVAIVALRLANN